MLRLKYISNRFGNETLNDDSHNTLYKIRLTYFHITTSLSHIISFQLQLALDH